MTLFSPLSFPMFRNVKLRGRKPGCPGCGTDVQRTRDASTSNVADEAAAFCGIAETPADARVSAKDLWETQETGRRPVLVDVRPAVEFGICALPGSLSE
jgi:adenylyltransferase/sulfurtransferase